MKYSLLLACTVLVAFTFAGTAYSSMYWSGTASHAIDNIQVQVDYSYSDGLTPQGVETNFEVIINVKSLDNQGMTPASLSCDGKDYPLNPANNSQTIMAPLSFTPAMAFSPFTFRLNYTKAQIAKQVDFLVYTEAGQDSWDGSLLLKPTSLSDIEDRTSREYEAIHRNELYEIHFTYIATPKILPEGEHDTRDILIIKMYPNGDNHIGMDTYFEWDGAEYTFDYGYPGYYEGMEYSLYSGRIEIPIVRTEAPLKLESFCEIYQGDDPIYWPNYEIVGSQKVTFTLSSPDAFEGNGGPLSVESEVH